MLKPWQWQFLSLHISVNFKCQAWSYARFGKVEKVHFLISREFVSVMDVQLGGRWLGLLPWGIIASLAMLGSSSEKIFGTYSHTSTHGVYLVFKSCKARNFIKTVRWSTDKRGVCNQCTRWQKGVWATLYTVHKTAVKWAQYMHI